jgi:hypothetical protein
MAGSGISGAECVEPANGFFGSFLHRLAKRDKQ